MAKDSSVMLAKMMGNPAHAPNRVNRTPLEHQGKSEIGGVSSTGKSFRVVRACARCVCLVSSGQKCVGRRFPFSLFRREVFPFPLREREKERKRQKERETEKEMERE